MKCFNKALNTEDYKDLKFYSDINDFRNELAQAGVAHRFEHPHRAWEYAMVAEALTLNGATTVLDVGGGGSALSSYLADIGFKVLVVDPGDVGKWIEDQKKVSKEVRENLSFEQMMFEDWLVQNPEVRFSAVICMSVIEHIEDDFEAFLSMLDLVEKDGLFFLTTDYHHTGMPLVAGHLRTYNEQRLAEMAFIAGRKGFELFGEGKNYLSKTNFVYSYNFASMALKRTSVPKPANLKKKVLKKKDDADVSDRDSDLQELEVPTGVLEHDTDEISV